MSARPKRSGGKKIEIEPGSPLSLTVKKSLVSATRMLPRMARDLQLFAPKGQLRVAVYASFFPVAYRAKVGGPKKRTEFRGLDVDLVKGFCRYAGLEPKFVPVKDFFDVWESPGHWGDRVDMAIGGIGRADYRDTGPVEWTYPYFRVRRTVVYNLKDPIRKFPEDVHGTIVGTMGSTGFIDAISRMERAGKSEYLVDRNASDERDLRELLDGKIQGVMRGSFVGRALVARHPKRLGMTEPWDAEEWLVGPAGEVFAFPCRRGSGLAGQLNVYLMRIAEKGELAQLIKKHRMDG